jgi:7-carboxy-7-deazaguanine synthase (Cx14CxxC type)
MTYAVKEIFYTLQGEGANVGRPAVFLRFAGCNLWSGLERDRETGQGGCSRWCDTNFVGTDGTGGGKFRSAEELANVVKAFWPQPNPSKNSHEAEKATTPFVVCTGGEPLLQLDEPLVTAFNALGCNVAVETNGTIDPPSRDLWLTVSPKANATLRITRGNELKLVYPQAQAEPERFDDLDFEHFFLQPLDGPKAAEHTERALEYCLAHPQWRLSLQTHKILRIP